MTTILCALHDLAACGEINMVNTMTPLDYLVVACVSVVALACCLALLWRS